MIVVCSEDMAHQNGDNTQYENSNSEECQIEKNERGVLWLEKTLENIDQQCNVLLYIDKMGNMEKTSPMTAVKHNTSRDISPTQPNQRSLSGFLLKIFNIYNSYLTAYFTKMTGVEKPGGANTPALVDSFSTFLVSLGLCLFLTTLHHFLSSKTWFIFMIPPFAVVVALIFDNFTAPFAQPRNVICGNIIGAVVSCILFLLLPIQTGWYAAPLAFSLIIGLQILTGNLHPPGGSIALLIYYGPKNIRDLGFYLLIPIATGSVFFVIVATAVLNLFPKRYYPKYWF